MTIEEASQLAGYQVATLNNSFSGFEATDDNYEIWVIQLQMYSKGPESRLVEQYWTLKDKSWFTLIQLPRPGESIREIKEGEFTSVGDILVKKLYHKAEGNVPTRVVYKWYNDDMRYTLIGTLTETLSEEMISKLVESVK